MDPRVQNRQASKLRTNIKAAVAQLDDWTSSQANLLRRRNKAIALSGGLRQYVNDARTRARTSQGTEFLLDSPCNLCGSESHLSDECDFIAVPTTNETSNEDPSSGIHRGIIHRLHSSTSELYRLFYPSFFPGLIGDPSLLQIPQALPVSSSPPDYQEIGIASSVSLLITLSATLEFGSFLQERALVDQVAQPYHSAAFPLDYTEFRDNIHQRWKGLPTLTQH